MSMQGAPADVPAVVASAAGAFGLGGFRRAYVRVQRDPYGVESLVFTLYEFADGVVYLSAAQPERAGAFAWRDAVRVYLGEQSVGGAGAQLISYRYVLEVTGGGSLTVGGTFHLPVSAFQQHLQVPDVERDLYAMLAESQRVVSERLLPLAREALANGKKVLFDKVKVGRAGLYTADSLIRWSSVASVKEVKGDMVVKIEGRVRPAWSVSMYHLPNSPLFMALVNELAAGR